jgi:uncharacterized membrane protein YedE/YeeE
MKATALAYAAGIVFAIGLGVAGMTNPDKVLGFLDVTGPWDPSLALVMIAAIAVHAGAAQWALHAERPAWADRFVLPRGGAIDAPLVAGAALFGLGWGMVGYCPGPALVDLAMPSRDRALFVAAMIAGVLAFGLRAAWKRRRASCSPDPARETDGSPV